jgi:hypothetical protein
VELSRDFLSLLIIPSFLHPKISTQIHVVLVLKNNQPYPFSFSLDISFPRDFHAKLYIYEITMGSSPIGWATQCRAKLNIGKVLCICSDKNNQYYNNARERFGILVHATYTGNFFLQNFLRVPFLFSAYWFYTRKKAPYCYRVVEKLMELGIKSTYHCLKSIFYLYVKLFFSKSSCQQYWFYVLAMVQVTFWPYYCLYWRFQGVYS